MQVGRPKTERTARPWVFRLDVAAIEDGSAEQKRAKFVICVGGEAECEAWVELMRGASEGLEGLEDGGEDGGRARGSSDVRLEGRRQESECAHDTRASVAAAVAAAVAEEGFCGASAAPGRSSGWFKSAVVELEVVAPGVFAEAQYKVTHTRRDTAAPRAA